MFEKLIKELEDLQNNRVSLPVKSDGDGYVDRECPNDDCLFVFKVHEVDWRDIFSDEAVFCPMCRHEAKSDFWWTQEQLKHAQEQAFKYVSSRIDKALVAGAQDFNSKQPRNAIQLTEDKIFTSQISCLKKDIRVFLFRSKNQSHVRKTCQTSFFSLNSLRIRVMTDSFT